MVMACRDEGIELVCGPFGQFLSFVFVIIDEKVYKKYQKIPKLPEVMEQNQTLHEATLLKVLKQVFLPGCIFFLDSVAGGSKK